jgi:hypothetical protein
MSETFVIVPPPQPSDHTGAGCAGVWGRSPQGDVVAPK